VYTIRFTGENVVTRTHHATSSAAFLISDLHSPITNLEHRSAFKNEIRSDVAKGCSKSAIGDYKSLMRTESATLNEAAEWVATGPV